MKRIHACFAPERTPKPIDKLQQIKTRNQAVARTADRTAS